MLFVRLVHLGGGGGGGGGKRDKCHIQRATYLFRSPTDSLRGSYFKLVAIPGILVLIEVFSASNSDAYSSL